MYRKTLKLDFHVHTSDDVFGNIRFINFNRKAVARADELGLPLLGTSDAHTLFQIGHTYTIVEAEKDAGAIIAAIKGGRSRLVTRPFGLWNFLRVLAFMRGEDMRRFWGRRNTGLE